MSASSSPQSPRKRGRPQITSLEPYKDLIVSLFTEEDLPILDIAQRLHVEHGLDISNRTISRRLTAWNVPRKKVRTPATQELRDRIVFHYNKNLNDEQIVNALHAEGYALKVRNLARLRKKLGMRRRHKYPGFRESSDEEDEGGADDLYEGGEGEAQEEDEDSEPENSYAGPQAQHMEAEERQAQAPRNPRGGRLKQNAALIPQVTEFVEKYMAKYDGSHDFNHIRRVVGLAHVLYTEMRTAPHQERNPSLGAVGMELDLQVITLAALLHDVGDKKYLEAGQDGNTLVLSTLLSLGAPADLAVKVQRIVLGVSYSSEIRDPAQVQSLVEKYPELAIVQDADRLDAIGAVGIGRTFTFSGAKGARRMGETMEHFEEKLEKLEGMMKTAAGKKLARERTERLKIFKGWWEEEQREAEGLLRRK